MTYDFVRHSCFAIFIATAMLGCANNPSQPLIADQYTTTDTASAGSVDEHEGAANEYNTRQEPKPTLLKRPGRGVEILSTVAIVGIAVPLIAVGVADFILDCAMTPVFGVISLFTDKVHSRCATFSSDNKAVSNDEKVRYE